MSAATTAASWRSACCVRVERDRKVQTRKCASNIITRVEKLSFRNGGRMFGYDSVIELAATRRAASTREPGMDFERSDKVKRLSVQVREFVEREVYPAEAVFERQLNEAPSRWQIPPVL